MKKIFALFALFAVLAGTGVAAYSWWDQVEQNESVTLNVGEAVILGVSLNDEETGNLVPSTAILKSGDVTQIDITYDLTLNTTGETFDLAVSYSNIEIGEAVTYADLVNITDDAPATISDAGATIVVSVTLDEPADETAYNAIADGDITFDATFLASEQA